MTTQIPLDVADRQRTVEYTLDDDETHTNALLEAFGRTDVDLETAEPRLAEVVDTDALGNLYDNSRTDLRTSFSLWGYPVVVRTGEIVIFPPDAVSDGGVDSD